MLKSYKHRTKFVLKSYRTKIILKSYENYTKIVGTKIIQTQDTPWL